MYIMITDSTIWKQAFPIKTKTVVGLEPEQKTVYENTLLFPPLQTVYELPNMNKENIGVPNVEAVEGFRHRKPNIMKSIKHITKEAKHNVNVSNIKKGIKVAENQVKKNVTTDNINKGISVAENQVKKNVTTNNINKGLSEIKKASNTVGKALKPKPTTVPHPHHSGPISNIPQTANLDKLPQPQQIEKKIEDPTTAVPVPKSNKQMMEDAKNELKYFLTNSSQMLESARTYVYNYIYEHCYWFIKRDVHLLVNSSAEEILSHEDLQKDAHKLTLFVLILLLTPFVGWATINWYYLLFFQEYSDKVAPIDFSPITKNQFLNFFIGLTKAPVELIDILLFKYIPNFDTEQNFSPNQTLNFIILFVVLLLFGINLTENSAYNVLTLGIFIAYGMGSLAILKNMKNDWLIIPLILFAIPIYYVLHALSIVASTALKLFNLQALITTAIVLGWLTWIPVFFYEFFSPPKIPTPFTIVIALLIVIFRLIICLTLEKQFGLASLCISIYLLVYSFGGIMLNETNWWSAVKAIFYFMERRDKQFYENNDNLLTRSLATLQQYLFRNGITVACFMFIISITVFLCKTVTFLSDDLTYFTSIFIKAFYVLMGSGVYFFGSP